MAGDSIHPVAPPGRPLASKGGQGPPDGAGPRPARQDLPAAGPGWPASAPIPAGSGESEPVNQAVEVLNEYVQSVNRDLQFSVDEASGRTVIKVLDAETQEVVRQIPSEEILALARHLREAMETAKGLILEVEA